MWPFKKKEKKDPLKSETLKQIKKINKGKKKEDKISELNKIFRIYLEEKYKIKSSLTYEELKNNIKKKRIDKELKEKIMFLEAEIYDIQYKFAKFDTKHLTLLKKNLKEIINFHQK